MKQPIITLILIITATLAHLNFSLAQENIKPPLQNNNIFQKITERIKLLDLNAPAAPENLSVSPSGWTNIDSFDITWVNPEDKSGIKGCFYKFDNPPSSDSDGLYIEENNISMLKGIQVYYEAEHTIYLWLSDARGNVDYRNYAVGVLKLDQTAPELEITSPLDESWVGLE